MVNPTCVDDEIILAVVNKGLASLGENPKKALWFCLEKDFNLDRSKLPENLETLQLLLQRFFGLGSKFLEALFIKYLSEATGENLNEQSSFVECVTHLRLKANEEATENAVGEESPKPVKLS